MYRLPLLGIRILDLTMSWAGPYATRLLADMGAEVIKIEAITSWDLLRTFIGRAPEGERWWDTSPYFNHINRNKYACALDLSKPRGHELFLRLATLADVVLENYRVDVMDNLGLTYGTLSAVNDRLIVVAMPAHGKTGPERDFIAYGTNAEQLAGLCHLTGYEDGAPHKTGISYGDPMAGVAAAGAVALALWHRRRTGRGQYIELSQRENLINVIGEYVVAFSATGREPARRGNRHSSMAPHGCYPCAGDDQWITIACEDDAQFAALCAVIGSPELARDERFEDIVSRHRNQQALDEIVAAWTREWPKENAAQALQDAGVSGMPVLSVREVFDDDHLRARDFFESVSHEVAGTWDIEGPHWRMSETPAHIRLPPPSFAEHNAYVFGELLGLSEEEIGQLEAEGITGATPDRTVHE
ncbi:MAG TPA: CoA transferase [Dehalococcoidia bacterium]|jgi:crotonobetainyl-CoA:carnitine CoA-transferase CaiB-like acyl-CoA transferase|nr:CoA transferase [Dehalococcoidia bacterium]